MTNSDIFKLNWKDIFKGLFVAVVTAVLTTALSMLQSGSLSIDWKTIGLTALTAAIAYLIKNVFQDADGNLVGKNKTTDIGNTDTASTDQSTTATTQSTGEVQPTPPTK